jgi:hypothetical protein
MPVTNRASAAERSHAQQGYDYRKNIDFRPVHSIPPAMDAAITRDSKGWNS